MSLGTLLVLIGLVLAAVSLAGERVGRYGGLLLPLSVVLVALGILVGAGSLVN